MAEGTTTNLLNQMTPGSPEEEEAITRLWSRMLKLAKMVVCRRAYDIRLLHDAAEVLEEGFIRLIRKQRQWSSAAEFLALAKYVMDDYLAEMERKLNAEKRRKGRVNASLDCSIDAAIDADDPLRSLMFREVLQSLREHDPIAYIVLEEHAFFGFTHAEIAARHKLTKKQEELLYKKAKQYVARHFPFESEA